MFETQPYILQKDFMDKAMEVGERVLLSVTTPQGLDGYANATQFVFDTDNYDINGDGIVETTPFRNKMLLITGMRFICEPSQAPAFPAALFGAVSVDGRVLLDQVYLNVLTGMEVAVDGLPQVALGAVPPVVPFTGIPPTTFNTITMQEAFGVPAIPCRNFLRVWTNASPPGPNASMVAFFNGLLLDRKV